jgi:hypothetical protein
MRRAQKSPKIRQTSGPRLRDQNVPAFPRRGAQANGPTHSRNVDAQIHLRPPAARMMFRGHERAGLELMQSRTQPATFGSVIAVRAAGRLSCVRQRRSLCHSFTVNRFINTFRNNVGSLAICMATIINIKEFAML